MITRPLRVSSAIVNISNLIGLTTDREKDEFVFIMNNNRLNDRDFISENRFLLNLEASLLERAREVSKRPNYGKQQYGEQHYG